MAKDLAVVLTNGGLNSAVAAALAAQKYRTILLCVEVAPRPGSRARAAYDQQVADFKPYREHTFPMPFPAALDGPTGAPQGSPLGPRLLDLLPLVAIAGRFAAHYNAVAIYLGLRVGSDTRQPERSPGDDLAQATEYFQIWNELLNQPCGLPEIEVVTPLLELEPWQVVDVGFQVAAPFDKTWSCEADGQEPCWACRGCRAREAAFRQAGKPDPIRGVKKS